MWLSQENEDKGRAQDCQQTETFRAQAVDHVSLTFPKSVRLLKQHHYRRIFKSGRRFLGELITINFRTGGTCAKLGITVSKKYGKAFQRNRFKRVVREAFRHSYPLLPSDMEMNVTPRKPFSKVTRQDILDDLHRFLNK